MVISSLLVAVATWWGFQCYNFTLWCGQGALKGWCWCIQLYCFTGVFSFTSSLFTWFELYMFYLVDNLVSCYHVGCTCFTLWTRFSKGDGMIGVLWCIGCCWCVECLWLVREVLMWPRAAVLGLEVTATMYIGLSHCVVS